MGCETLVTGARGPCEGDPGGGRAVQGRPEHRSGAEVACRRLPGASRGAGERLSRASSRAAGGGITADWRGAERVFGAPSRREGRHQGCAGLPRGVNRRRQRPTGGRERSAPCRVRHRRAERAPAPGRGVPRTRQRHRQHREPVDAYTSKPRRERCAAVAGDLRLAMQARAGSRPWLAGPSPA